MQVVTNIFLSTGSSCNNWYNVVIFHLRLCVQMIRSRDLHYTQGSCQFLSVGPLQMVSEHYVACRFETLGLDRNRFDHRIENLFLFCLLKTKPFILFSCTLTFYLPSENIFSCSRWPVTLCPSRHVLVMTISWRSKSDSSYGKLRFNMKHYMHGRPLKNTDSELKYLEDFEESWRRTWITQEEDRL